LRVEKKEKKNEAEDKKQIRLRRRLDGSLFAVSVSEPPLEPPPLTAGNLAHHSLMAVIR
jgi:hypothetical protein